MEALGTDEIFAEASGSWHGAIHYVSRHERSWMPRRFASRCSANAQMLERKCIQARLSCLRPLTQHGQIARESPIIERTEFPSAADSGRNLLARIITVKATSFIVSVPMLGFTTYLAVLCCEVGATPKHYLSVGMLPLNKFNLRISERTSPILLFLPRRATGAHSKKKSERSMELLAIGKQPPRTR